MMAQGGETQAAGGLVEVVLLGHSYVRRLSEYAGQSPTTAHLGMSDIRIRFVCQGGMTLRPNKPGKCIRDHLTELRARPPAVIILHIGENDLGENVSAGEVVGEIVHLVSDITHDCQCAVYVTQLLPWPKHSEKVRNDILEINEELKNTLPSHHFWRHRRGLNSCNPAVFLQDKVHLNDTGMAHYFDSMRTLVGRAVKHPA